MGPRTRRSAAAVHLPRRRRRRAAPGNPRAVVPRALRNRSPVRISHHSGDHRPHRGTGRPNPHRTSQAGSQQPPQRHRRRHKTSPQAARFLRGGAGHPEHTDGRPRHRRGSHRDRGRLPHSLARPQDHHQPTGRDHRDLHRHAVPEAGSTAGRGPPSIDVGRGPAAHHRTIDEPSRTDANFVTTADHRTVGELASTGQSSRSAAHQHDYESGPNANSLGIHNCPTPPPPPPPPPSPPPPPPAHPPPPTPPLLHPPPGENR